MSVTQKVHAFPSFPIDKQVFYVPGLSTVGGFTSGGARMMSAEPGGFAVLDIQPALQVNEWDYPETSWLMSQTNGKVLLLRLAPTPQICGGQALVRDGVTWDDDLLWSNNQAWAGDFELTFTSAASEGSTTVRIDTGLYGAILRRGHVIGHGYSAYKIDEIRYLTNTLVEVSVTPPFRKTVVIGDKMLSRPYFMGMISNTSDIIESYDSENVGHIQMPKITLVECIVDTFTLADNDTSVPDVTTTFDSVNLSFDNMIYTFDMGV